MKEFYLKQSAYSNGFETRLDQLIRKEAARREMMAKEANMLARGMGMAFKGMKALPGMVGRNVGKIGPGVRRMGNEFMSEFNTAAGRPLSASQSAIQGSRSLARNNKLMDTHLGPQTAPGSMAGPEATEWARANGLLTPTPAAAGGAGAAQAAAAPAAAAGGAGAAWRAGGRQVNLEDPSRMQSLWNQVPEGARNWLGQNKGMLGGVAGGAGAMYGLDAIGDSRRREAIRNMGAMERLGLAGRLVFNPEGVANML